MSIQQCTRKECVSGHLQNRDADKLIHMETVRYKCIFSLTVNWWIVCGQTSSKNSMNFMNKMKLKLYQNQKIRES
jgi:hypothetical protein